MYWMMMTFDIKGTIEGCLYIGEGGKVRNEIETMRLVGVEGFHVRVTLNKWNNYC